MADEEWEKFFGDKAQTQVTKTAIQAEKPLQEQDDQTRTKIEYKGTTDTKITDEELFSEFGPKKSGSDFFTIGILSLVMVIILYAALYFLKYFQVYDFSKTTGFAIFAPVDMVLGTEKESGEVEIVKLSEADIDEIRKRLPEMVPSGSKEIPEEVGELPEIPQVGEEEEELPAGVPAAKIDETGKIQLPEKIEEPVPPQAPTTEPEPPPVVEPAKPEVTPPAPAPKETAAVSKPPPKEPVRVTEPVAPSKPKAAISGVEYTLQIGSFAIPENVETTKGKLVALGFSPDIKTVEGKVNFWFVRVGKYKDISSAERILNILGDLDLSGSIVSPQAGIYSVEMGGYVDKSTAEGLLKKIQGYGYQGDLVNKKFVEELQQIRVGRYSSKELASGDLQKLRKEGLNPIFAVY